MMLTEEIIDEEVKSLRGSDGVWSRSSTCGDLSWSWLWRVSTKKAAEYWWRSGCIRWKFLGLWVKELSVAGERVWRARVKALEETSLWAEKTSLLFQMTSLYCIMTSFEVLSYAGEMSFHTQGGTLSCASEWFYNSSKAVVVMQRERKTLRVTVRNRKSAKKFMVMIIALGKLLLQQLASPFTFVQSGTIGSLSRSPMRSGRWKKRKRLRL